MRKMKRWKRIGLAGACIGTIAMTAAGCLPSGESSDAGKAEGGTAQISFSWWGNDDRHQATQSAIDAFNAAHEGEISVKGEPSGFGNLDETFATRYAGGTAADLMTVNYPWMIQYSPEGEGFYDLEQVSDIIDLSQYDEEFLEFGKRNGVLQAVPYGQNTLGFYINKSALERAGVTEIPTTFEGYKEVAKIVTAKDPNAYLYVSPTFRFAGIYYLQQKTGVGEFADDLSMNYTVEDYKEALEWYKDLADAHVFCSRKDYIENVGTDPVSIAQNAKYINGGYLGALEWTGGIESNAKTLEDNGDELVVAPLPVIENAAFNGTMAKPSLLFAISKDSKYPEQTAEFMQYILNDPEGVELMGSTRGLVASKAAVQTLEESGDISGAVQQAYEFTDTAPVINNSPIFENAVFTTAYESNYEQYELGQLTSEEAAQAIYDTMQTEVEKLQKEYGVK